MITVGLIQNYYMIKCKSNMKKNAINVYCLNYLN